MVASFNKSSQPVKTTDRVPEWTPGGAEFMVGDQVRRPSVWILNCLGMGVHVSRTRDVTHGSDGQNDNTKGFPLGLTETDSNPLYYWSST